MTSILTNNFLIDMAINSSPWLVFLTTLLLIACTVIICKIIFILEEQT